MPYGTTLVMSQLDPISTRTYQKARFSVLVIFSRIWTGAFSLWHSTPKDLSIRSQGDLEYHSIDWRRLSHTLANEKKKALRQVQSTSQPCVLIPSFDQAKKLDLKLLPSALGCEVAAQKKTGGKLVY